MPRLPPTILGMPLPMVSMDALACLLSALGVETWRGEILGSMESAKCPQSKGKISKQLRSVISVSLFFYSYLSHDDIALKS